MAKRERVQLAHKYNPKKHFISGWYVSEKLDGMRCYWDGGITTGLPKTEVPWANCEKDDRLLNTQVSTGLWSRLGNVVHAPDWWVAQLPSCPADGELYINRDTYRQDLMSVVKKIVPIDHEWKTVHLRTYGLPSYEKMFPEHMEWIKERLIRCLVCYRPSDKLVFRQEYFLLKAKFKGTRGSPVEQKELPLNGKLAPVKMNEFLDWVVEMGGEGIMLRNPNEGYECCRSYHLLKHKPSDDAEATVMGFITGRETDLGSKLLGLMGAMIIRTDDGITFELSGFSNVERELAGYHHTTAVRAKAWAEAHPETECPGWISCVYFKRGDRITFKYRGKTSDGVPQEARYWRPEDRI